jgi:outer membrane protein TolC
MLTRPYRALIALPLSLACLAAGLRADALDLATAQAEAAGRSPVLGKLDADLKAADAGRWEVLADRLPQVGVKAEHILDAKYPDLQVLFGGSSITFPGAFPQDTVDLSLRWTLFDGFRGLERWRAAGLSWDAARLERRHAGDQLALQVAVSYYRALAALQLSAVSDQDVATLKDHLVLAQASEDSGSSTDVDVLRIKAQIEEGVADAEQASDQAQQARLELAQAMGLSQDARTLDGALPVPDAALSVDDWMLQPGGRDDLTAQQERQGALAHQAQAAQGAWWPQVYVFGLKEWYHYGDFDPLILATQGLSDMSMAGVGATWSLFAGGGDLARQHEAQAQAQSSAQALASSRLQAERDFQDWKHRYHYSVRLYQARQRSVEEYQESVRLAQLGFKAGTQTSTEVLDAETDLFRARAGLVQAQANAAEALLQLQLARGRSAD